MKIKSLLLLIYAFSGLAIASFTALMTYLIIDEPIGMKMFSKISLSVLFTLPMIALVSYLTGRFLSKKFMVIQSRLELIAQTNRADFYEDGSTVDEIKMIHGAIDLLASRLESTIASLKEKNDTLSTMMVSFSHDIKTPLTIINGYIEEIEDGLIPFEDIPKTLSILKKESSFINEISLDIITYIQSVQQGRPKERIDLKRLLHEEILPLLRPQVPVSLDIDLPDEFTVEFNPIDIKKTLFNLLHNSTKFTKSGYIRVYHSEDRIIIEDTGIGIPLPFHKTIFHPFTTVDKSKNRKESGFGLGLSISYNLASGNGYTLRLNPDYVGGSQFVLDPLSPGESGGA